MLDRTDHAAAPWVLVEAEDKRWARVKVAESVVRPSRRAWPPGTSRFRPPLRPSALRPPPPGLTSPGARLDHAVPPAPNLHTDID